jgi:hypothetical protein
MNWLYCRNSNSRMETFLMVRRKKSTMFLMCSEGDTISQIKRKLAAILREDAGAIGLFQDKDGAMVEAADADHWSVTRHWPGSAWPAPRRAPPVWWPPSPGRRPR